MGRTNMRYPYPEAGGISQPQRAAGQPLPFTTEKHTGSGIDPGVSDCETTVFPRRHCTPLGIHYSSYYTTIIRYSIHSMLYSTSPNSKELAHPENRSCSNVTKVYAADNPLGPESSQFFKV